MCTIKLHFRSSSNNKRCFVESLQETGTYRRKEICLFGCTGEATVQERWKLWLGFHCRGCSMLVRAQNLYNECIDTVNCEVSSCYWGIHAIWKCLWIVHIFLCLQLYYKLCHVNSMNSAICESENHIDYCETRGNSVVT